MQDAILAILVPGVAGAYFGYWAAKNKMSIPLFLVLLTMWAILYQVVMHGILHLY